MILNIFPRLTLIKALENASSPETVKRELEEYAERQKEPLAFLAERVCSVGSHDYDIIVRRRKGIYEILLRRR